jgi:hypothetical protein
MNYRKVFRIVLSGFIIFIFLSFMGAPVFADNGKNCTSLSKEKITSTLKKMNWPPVEILSTAKSPIEGMCEIIVEGGGTVRIFYSDSSLDYLLLGTLVETKNMTNITADRAQKMQDKKRIDLAKIPLAGGLFIGEKGAGKKVIIFTDPD